MRKPKSGSHPPVTDETKSTKPYPESHGSCEPTAQTDRHEDSVSADAPQPPSRRTFLTKSGKLIAYSAPVIVMLVPSRALAAYSISGG